MNEFTKLMDEVLAHFRAAKAGDQPFIAIMFKAGQIEPTMRSIQVGATILAQLMDGPRGEARTFTVEARHGEKGIELIAVKGA